MLNPVLKLGVVDTADCFINRVFKTLFSCPQISIIACKNGWLKENFAHW